MTPALRGLRLESVLVAIWALAHVACFLWPNLTDSPTLVDDLVRNPVRVALVGYALGAALILVSSATDWRERTRLWRLARAFWCLGFASFFIHVLAAFHHYHSWSHAEAVAHVESVSGLGQGLWFSYLFTVLWGLDVLTWLAWPGWYARRPRWIDVALQSYMAFITFNATVVYESGWIRWAGAVMFLVLGGLVVRRIA
jgi:hypothetical protein